MFSWFKKDKDRNNTEIKNISNTELVFDDKIAREILSDIREEYGLDYSKQEHITMRKIERFAIKNSLSSFSQLQNLLQTSSDIKEKLINMLTVGETYFYREIGHFKILSQITKTKKIKKILCAPSSSGEEVYSILLYLSNLSDKMLDIDITGIDINSDAIVDASTACYSKRSISLLPRELLDRYFTCKMQRYCIDNSIKRYAKFIHQNIFNKNIKNLGKFDVIFCRNMLIYFDDRQKREVIAILRDMLVDNGMLFIGHADVSFNLNGFEKISMTDGSYYLKSNI